MGAWIIKDKETEKVYGTRQKQVLSKFCTAAMEVKVRLMQPTGGVQHNTRSIQLHTPELWETF